MSCIGYGCVSEKPKPWRGTPQHRTEDEMQPKHGRRACGLCLGTCVLPSRGAIAMISLIGTGFGVATQSWQSVCAWLVIISSIAACTASYACRLERGAAPVQNSIQTPEKRWTRICEGLPKRVGPKPGEIGVGRSGGPRGYAGWGYAGVTPPCLADKSEGSGQ